VQGNSSTLRRTAARVIGLVVESDVALVVLAGLDDDVQMLRLWLMQKPLGAMMMHSHIKMSEIGIGGFAIRDQDFRFRIPE